MRANSFEHSSNVRASNIEEDIEKKEKMRCGILAPSRPIRVTLNELQKHRRRGNVC